VLPSGPVTPVPAPSADDAALELVRALGSKDFDSEEHALRVAQAAWMLGQQARLSETELNDLYHAGALHDVGKIAIPDAILFKPATLDELEMETIRLHPVIGEQMVRTLPAAGTLRPTIRHHHERIDGGGYPDGLRGGRIPMGARIIAIVDSFDAIVSDRPYRRGRSHEDAVIVLRQGAGSQWDPELVILFVDKVLPSLLFVG
jgi:HD-GYP domain-containing protein (c-di-GMP phosphodiesterase class II)